MMSNILNDGEQSKKPLANQFQKLNIVLNQESNGMKEAYGKDVFGSTQSRMQMIMKGIWIIFITIPSNMDGLVQLKNGRIPVFIVWLKWGFIHQIGLGLVWKILKQEKSGIDVFK